MTDTDSNQHLLETRNLHEFTCVLQSIEEGSGDLSSLIPLIYGELKRIAAHQLALERPGHTLQATALVHEAYLRMLNPNTSSWQNRRHFLNAAAEAMRRILIENARRKRTAKRGGDPKRVELEMERLAIEPLPENVLDLNEALEELELADPECAEVVKLRFFAGLTIRQVAQALNISTRTVDNLWAFAKVWLCRRLKK